MRRLRVGCGFTLVEVMVVVGVLLVLMSLCIQGLVRAKIAANETATLGAMKTIYAAVEIYRQREGSYPRVMADMTAAGGADPAYIVDELDTAGTGRPRAGYNFHYLRPGGGMPAFFVLASPGRRGLQGIRLFYIDEDGVIRSSLGSFTNEAAARAWPAVSGG